MPNETIASMVFVSDLHLTDRVEDEYRWSIFDSLIGIESRLRLDRDYYCGLFILGDLTDRKDRHQSRFVNRVLENIHALRESYDSVDILCGNHDYYYEDAPFFSLLRYCVRGNFIDEPFFYTPEADGFSLLALPHSRNPEWDWKQSAAWGRARNHVANGQDIHAVLCHQTFEGAKFSSGIVADGGCSQDIFDEFSPFYVISGDVHIAQQVGRVRYIGSPYPINYGDDIPGRALILTAREQGELLPHKISLSEIPLAKHFPRKLVLELDNVEEISDEILNEGDMVKVRLRTTKSDHVLWPEMREYIRNFCAESGVFLKGIELVTAKQSKQDGKQAVPSRETPLKSLERYCKKNNVPKELVDVGAALFEEKLDA